MPRLNESHVADFDADTVCDAVLDTVEGPLLAFVEFDRERLNTIYVAEETVEFYEERRPSDGEAAMLEHFGQVHDYINLDFTEQDLFTESLFPEAERVEYLVTAMDLVKLVRVYLGDVALYIAVAPEEPVTPIVDVIRESLED